VGLVDKKKVKKLQEHRDLTAISKKLKKVK